jgi:hypothetical protein
MLWLIQNILFSISLIVVIHYLYIYFETTLTAPKVKDLIHCPKQKYKSLFDTINQNLDNSSTKPARGKGSEMSAYDSTSSTNLGIDEYNDRSPNENNSTISNGRNDMKTDLKAFLRGIGLKSKSAAEMSFRPSYETS